MLIQAELGLALTSIPVTGKPAGAGCTEHTSWRAAGTPPCPATGGVLRWRTGYSSKHDERRERGPVVEVSNLFLAVAALILLAVTSGPYGAGRRWVEE